MTVATDEDGDAVVVRAVGEIGLDNAETLRQSLLKGFKSRASAMTLDLRKVSFIDSEGLQLLVWATLRDDTGKRLRMRCAPGPVRDAIEECGLGPVLPLTA